MTVLRRGGQEEHVVSQSLTPWLRIPVVSDVRDTARSEQTIQQHADRDHRGAEELHQ
jgi:hypothetical protein